MSERPFDLKLASGKVVTWPGVDAEAAARRYVDVHRGEAVVATRPGDRHGIFVWGGARIIEG